MDQSLPILHTIMDLDIGAEYLQKGILGKYLDSNRSVKRAYTPSSAQYSG
jgi:hypothetical protein